MPYAEIDVTIADDTAITPKKRGRPSNADKKAETEAELAKIHADALIEFNRIWGAQEEVRKQCKEERRFAWVPGAQWEGPLGDQFERKPKFEVNKIQGALTRIYGDYRNNRITATFEPKDGERSAQTDELADVCAGLMRSDERDSMAEEADDNCFEEGTSGGIGAMRLRARYEDPDDDENDNQRIDFEPIFDADQCVYFDLDAKRQDKADAMRAWVLTGMTPESAEAAGYATTTWPKPGRDVAAFDWMTPNTIFIAEHYRVEKEAQNVQVWVSSVGDKQRFVEDTDDDTGEKYWCDEDGNEADFKQLKTLGWKKKSEKSVKRRRVHKYLMSGARIEEDCGYIAGPNIPIAVFYGKRAFIENIERCQGHGRNAMDAQRLANMQRSKLAEISALSSVEKPIFTPEQMAGHTTMWQDDNVKNYPYLLINAITDASGQKVPAGPIGYTKAPQIPPAMAVLLQVSEQDLRDLLGNEQAAENGMMQQQSGVAVELTQTRIDERAFIYVSNFAKMKRRAGEIWLGMARELYVKEGRKMKTVNAQNEVSSVELNAGTGVDKATTGTYAKNNLTRANFDLAVDVGPSSNSQRAATVRAVTGLLGITKDPQNAAVLEALAIMNMEGEGVTEAREFYRQKLVKMGVLKPTDEEAKAMAQEAANTPPDPQAQYLAAAADQAKADAGKKHADTMLSLATAAKTDAQTAEIKHGMGLNESAAALDHSRHALEVGKTLHEAGKPQPTAAPGAVQ